MIRKKRKLILITTLVILVLLAISVIIVLKHDFTLENIYKYKIRDYINNYKIIRLLDTITNDEIDNDIYKSNFIIDCIPSGGDCFLIMHDNKTLLIDTGQSSEYSEISATLESYNIQKIDILMLTHFHFDHFGNALKIINDYQIGSVLIPDTTSQQNRYKEEAKLVYLSIIEKSKNNYDIIHVNENMKLILGTIEIDFLNPIQGNIEDMTENNLSIVCQMSYSGLKFLFAGDIETESKKRIINKGYDIESDFFKVPHHGTTLDAYIEFNQMVKSEYAVISNIQDINQTILNNLYDIGSVVDIINNEHIVYSINKGHIITARYDSLT